jgi:hypothetical protein
VGLRFTDVELSGELGGRCGVLPVRAPDAADIDVANCLEALNVKSRVEAAADEADAEGFGRHEIEGCGAMSEIES